MSDWLAKAYGMFPEFEEDRQWDSPMSLWHEIWFMFEAAYSEPQNESLIQRTYDFADWCLLYKPRSDDASQYLLTCVAVCFFEHIPTCPAARADVPRWFKRDEIILMKDTFSYFLEDGEFEQLLSLFGEPKSQRKIKREGKKRK